MHIPDGYLGPPTCIAGYAIMFPLWAIASRRVRTTLQARQVPLLAIAAAFCFVIMLFNVPIPGGTTGHAVGGVLAAILLGPWAACIAVSVALVIQALLFGDGGITALGANCFNMAFVLPFVGYALYRLIGAKSEIASFRRVIAAGDRRVSRTRNCIVLRGYRVRPPAHPAPYCIRKLALLPL